MKDKEYYESLDKRTKEYKDWKEQFDKKNKGVGDKIEDFTKKTGIEKVVKAIAGDDCGCEERKEKLNKIFRHKKMTCPTQEDYEYMKSVYEVKAKITPDQQKELRAIYERVFNVKLTSSCMSCSFISTIYNPLRKVYNLSK